MLQRTLRTEFSTAPYANIPAFCRGICFNNFSSRAGTGAIDKVSYRNHQLRLTNVGQEIYSLRVSSSGIIYWTDLWLDQDGYSVDPGIISLDLTNNLLSSFTVEEQREKLEHLNLSANENLESIYLPLAPNIRDIELNNLPKLKSVTISSEKRTKSIITHLSMKKSNIPAGFISSLSFDTDLRYGEGLIDLSDSDNSSLSGDDIDLLEYLETTGKYTIKQQELSYV